jgi:hypothetical protein
MCSLDARTQALRDEVQQLDIERGRAVTAFRGDVILDSLSRHTAGITFTELLESAQSYTKAPVRDTITEERLKIALLGLERYETAPITWGRAVRPEPAPQPEMVSPFRRRERPLTALAAPSPAPSCPLRRGMAPPPWALSLRYERPLIADRW